MDEIAEESGDIQPDFVDSPQFQQDVIEQEGEELKVCQYFLSGKCHFGDRCRLTHSVPVSEVSETPTTEDNDDGNDRVKGKKNKNNRTNTKSDKKKKEANEEEKKETKKKPRMRTADDVISRILWDPSIDPADFVVGHLDRFLGVLERPFSEFSWDTQVCDCDYSEELALPRHRIQYFSFRGQRVWDRDSRTDRVFGSTGQPLAPPFGVVEKEDCHPEGNITTEMEHQESSNSVEDLSDKPLEGAREHSEEEFVEALVTKNEEETKPLKPEEKLGLIPSGKKGHQETGSESKARGEDPQESPGLPQMTAVLSLAQRDGQMTKEEEEWKDDWEGEEKSDILAWRGFSCSLEDQKQSQCSPQEQRAGRPAGRPTHFVCFRVDSPAVLQAFQRVQRKVLSHLPQSEPFWIKPPLLHVTMCLLVLQGPADIDAASQLLRNTVRNLRKPPISVSFPPKLKHFGGRVLYLSPSPLPDLQGLNTPLQEAFKGRGWLHRHSRCPTYHLTLAKAEYGSRPFEGVGVVKMGKDVNFGKLEVKNLHLCEISAPRTETEFYRSACTVQIPEV